MRRNKSVEALIIGLLLAAIFLSLSPTFKSLLKPFIDSEMIVSKGAHIIACAFMGIIIYIIHKFIILLITDNELRRPRFRESAAGFVAVVSVMVVIKSLATIVNSFIDCSIITAGNIEAGYGQLDLPEKIVVLVSTSIAVPLIEEIIFRGIIFGALNKIFNLHVAAAASALLFGVLHGMSLFTVIGTGMMGLILAYICGIYGNLGNAIFIHGAYNFMVSFSAMIGEKSIASADSPSTWPIIALSVIMIVLYGYIIRHIIKLLKKDLKKERRKKNEYV